MARKRLAIARERETVAAYWVEHSQVYGAVVSEMNWALANHIRKRVELRAIERRKDRIA
jgi:hypothetical protein